MSDDDTYDGPLDIGLNLYVNDTGVLREVVIMPVSSGLGGPVALVEVTWPDPDSEIPKLVITSNCEFDDLRELLGGVVEVLDEQADELRAGLGNHNVVDGEVVVSDTADEG